LLTGNGNFVFPGANDKNKPISNNTILYALYRLGYRDRMTGHGFRGLASTILHENGFDEAHIELQLAHMKRDKVAAAYNQAKYLKQRTEMMQWWADYLDAKLAKGTSSMTPIVRVALRYPRPPTLVAGVLELTMRSAAHCWTSEATHATVRASSCTGAEKLFARIKS
jgi:hypothetical protein